MRNQVSKNGGTMTLVGVYVGSVEAVLIRFTIAIVIPDTIVQQFYCMLQSIGSTSISKNCAKATHTEENAIRSRTKGRVRIDRLVDNRSIRAGIYISKFCASFWFSSKVSPWEV